MTRPARVLRDDEKAKVSQFFPSQLRRQTGRRTPTPVDQYRAEDRELAAPRPRIEADIRLARCGSCREWLTESSKRTGACGACGIALTVAPALALRAMPRPGELDS